MSRIDTLFEGLADLTVEYDPVILEQEERIPETLWHQLWELGLFQLTIPEIHGGLGADSATFCRAMQTLGSISPALVITAVPHLCNGVKGIMLGADEALQGEVFAKVIHERKLLSFALNESHTGSDVSSHGSCLSMSQGEILLNGSKRWITNANKAAYLLVIAKSDSLGGPPGSSSMVLLDPDNPGLTMGPPWHKIGANASHSLDLYFDSCPVRPERVLGGIGQAMNIFFNLVEDGRIGAAAATLGILDAAFTQANSTLTERNYHSQVLGRTLAFALEQISAQPNSRNVIVAFAKLFITMRVQRLLCDLFIQHPQSDVLRQLMCELPFFTVLEGPNEVICLPAALKLLTNLANGPALATQPWFQQIKRHKPELAEAYDKWLHRCMALDSPLQNQNAMLLLAMATGWCWAACAQVGTSGWARFNAELDLVAQELAALDSEEAPWSQLEAAYVAA